MQDRPTVLELLAAVRDFLERDLAPTIAEAHLKYHLLIAINVLRLVERELPGDAQRLSGELGALHALLDLPVPLVPADPERLRPSVLEANQELCERIRRGQADAGPWRETVLAYVHAQVREKLRIDNPGELRASP